MRIKCPNYLMKEKTKESKDKWLVETWSDIENDSSDEYVDECSYVMAFAASIDKVIMESASDSEDFSDDEIPKKMTLQEAYDKLCTEFIKSEKTYHLCRKELNEVKTKKVEMLIKIDDVGGQNLSFCVGLKTPFTSKGTSEEEETFGKTP